MTLKTACEIADECGLTDLGEAILNIELHAIQTFSYDEVNKELSQLYEEVLRLGKDWEDISIYEILEE